jgi:hypothetical protein
MDEEQVGSSGTPAGSAPGRAPVTARLSPRPLIFRVDNPDAARELGAAFGPRNSNGVAAGADVAVQRAAESSGTALPADVRGRFEGSLGADLGGVRVHTGGASAEAASAVGARAYTTGQDIHFGAGQYAPTDPFGLHLLAHEVAHTVQQSGGAATTQYKLEVSSPGDALEHEADRAADAMVAGRPAANRSTAAAGIGRKIFRDVAGGPLVDMLGDGDGAENTAKKQPLQIDTVSVNRDMKDVESMVADITANSTKIRIAENGDLDGKKDDFLATNSMALAKLSIFTDKLNVTTVDTSAFAVQYRAANADFRRLNAEAHTYLANDGLDAKSGDIADAASSFKAPKIGLEQGALTQTLLSDFMAARNNLNTAAVTMKGKITTCRGHADGLQGALYKVRAAAASLKVKEDQDKLDGIRQEISDTAAGVGTIVKLVTAVAGFAGGGGATSAALSGVQQTPTGPTMKSPGSVTIDAGSANVPANLQGTSLGAVLGGQKDVDLDPEGTSKLAIAKSLYADAGKLTPGAIGDVDLGGGLKLGDVMGGDPAKLAEGLVKAIGEYANKKKISSLEDDIAAKKAEVEAFSQAAGALDMASKAELLAGSADELAKEVKAFADTKRDLTEKADKLEAHLATQGKKGQDQAKGILFLTDADRFLAQAENAIDVGENQQANLQKAAEDRKSLRGTDANIGDDKDRETQHYYKLSTLGPKPWNVSGKFYYRAERLDVKFTGSGATDPNDPNAWNQGGAGTVEGVGSADDAVANRIQQLKDWKTKVAALRTAVQDALFGKGKGAPIVNG